MNNTLIFIKEEKTLYDFTALDRITLLRNFSVRVPARKVTGKSDKVAYHYAPRAIAERREASERTDNQAASSLQERGGRLVLKRDLNLVLSLKSFETFKTHTKVKLKRNAPCTFVIIFHLFQSSFR